MSIADNARAQHNAFFWFMARGGRWHLYRAPGSDNVALMREDAEWDVPVWPVMVANVHAMSADTLSARVQSIVRS